MNNMCQDNLINQTAISYNESISQALYEITRPLYDYLGFNHFAYTKFIPGQRYMTLNVDTKLLKSYFEESLDHLLLFNGLLFEPYSKKVVVWGLNESNPLLDLMSRFGYQNGISIFYRGEDQIEAWHFAVGSDKSDYLASLAQDIKLLEEFIIYFQEKAHHLIEASDPSRLALFRNGASFDVNSFSQGVLSIGDSRQAFLKAIEHKKFGFQIGQHFITLSTREFKCLRSLSEGLSAKVIAHNEELSPRTVQSVIESIKMKFQMNTKVQLAEVYNRSIYRHMIG